MKKKLLIRLSSMQFGMLETRMFLDTHPNDPEALALFNKYFEKYKALVAEYEAQFGPLTLNGMNSDEWLNNPWPWDNNFACEDNKEDDDKKESKK